MKELIKELRERANENIQYGQNPNAKNWGDEEGIVISNAEALQIAAAMEAATYPPVVREKYALFEYLIKEFGATATDDQLRDIVEIVCGLDEKDIALARQAARIIDARDKKRELQKTEEQLNGNENA